MTNDTKAPCGAYGARVRQLLDAGATAMLLAHAIESFALGRGDKVALGLWVSSRPAPLTCARRDEPIVAVPTAGQLLRERLVAVSG